MAENSKIEWTDATWNPVRGCDPVSPGCANCYAAEVAARFSGPGQPYEGLATRHPGQPAKWTGMIRMVPEKLAEPLSWRKPRRVFVNSMSDLFHEDVPFEFIDECFVVMALARQHTFQVLTKRAERLRQWALASDRLDRLDDAIIRVLDMRDRALDGYDSLQCFRQPHKPHEAEQWPIPNVWLGVSVENQAAADERIPLLLQCPAAVRFLSCEPLLGPLQLDSGPRGGPPRFLSTEIDHPNDVKLDWVIVGGESGLAARYCDVAWIRSIVEQCQAASVPCFVKQLGSNPLATASITTPNLSGGDGRNRIEWATKDRKGGDPAEWPADLRVRQWPQPVTLAKKLEGE